MKEREVFSIRPFNLRGEARAGVSVVVEVVSLGEEEDEVFVTVEVEEAVSLRRMEEEPSVSELVLESSVARRTSARAHIRPERVLNSL